MGLFSMLVSDVPYDVEVQLQRQSFINNKIIDKVADEIEEVNLEDKTPDLTVADKDDGVYFKDIAELFLIGS